MIKCLKESLNEVKAENKVKLEYEIESKARKFNVLNNFVEKTTDRKEEGLMNFSATYHDTEEEDKLDLNALH